MYNIIQTTFEQKISPKIARFSVFSKLKKIENFFSVFTQNY